MNCVLCQPQANNEVMLSNLISAFKTIVEKLECHINLESKNQKQKQNELEQKLQEERCKNKSLEDNWKKAEDNSDLYQGRLIEAQETIIAMQRDSNLKSHPGNDEKTLERKKNDSMCPLFVRKVVSPMKTPYILAPDTCDVTFISSGEEDFVKETKRKSPRKTPKTSQSSSDLKQFSPNTVRDGVSLKPSLALNKKSKPNAELDLDETRLDCYGEMDASLFNDDGDDELLKDTSHCDIFDSCDEWDSFPSSPILSACKDKRLRCSARTSILTLDDQILQGEDGAKSPSLLEKNHPFFNRFSVKKKIVKPLEGKYDKGFGDNPMLDSLPLHHNNLCSGSASSLKHLGNRSSGLLTSLNTSLDELFNKTDGDLETTTMLKTEKPNDDSEEGDNDTEFEEYMTVCDENTPPGLCDVSGNQSHQQGLNQKERSKVPLTELQDSFDIVPTKTDNKPKFKYQEVVRKQSERRKLDGKACEQCEAFFEDVPEEERKDALRDVCRHKHVYAPPSTPEHFWEIQFPSTAECKKRGAEITVESRNVLFQALFLPFFLLRFRIYLRTRFYVK